MPRQIKAYKYLEHREQAVWEGVKIGSGLLQVRVNFAHGNFPTKNLRSEQRENAQKEEEQN